jgi:hypothetical protein
VSIRGLNNVHARPFVAQTCPAGSIFKYRGYNQFVKRLLMLAVLVLAACNRPARDKESIKLAVMHHLQSRSGLDVASIDVEVASVDFKGDEANALVAFKAKGSTDPNAAMQMRYVLESRNGKWSVKSRSEGGSPHGRTEPAQPGGGMPPPESDGAMPPGHPPVPEQSPAPRP